MRIYYFLKVSLLAVILSTLKEGGCKRLELSRSRCEAGQGGPEELESESNQPQYVEDIEQGVRDMPGNPNMMELEDAAVQDIEQPELPRREGGPFDGLSGAERVKLLENLSARDWDGLLGKAWVTDEDYEKAVTILYYTLNYDEARLLRMLGEALESNLEHLFVGMCDPAYVPRTHGVTQLLERGLEVYPHLRHWILFTIYQLEYPTTRWHLDNTEEDAGLLKGLIEARLIRREAIAGHLVEIVTLYPLEILHSLLTENVLAMHDVCSTELYDGVWDRDGREYLKWAKDKCGLEPVQGHIDAAVSEGREEVLDFITEELGVTRLPRQNAVNEAAANGKLRLLYTKCPEWGLFPNTEGANGAAMNGHLDVLRWLAALEPEKRRVYPNQSGADLVAKKGDVDVLEWLAEQQVYPSKRGAELAAMMGHLDVLKWLMTLKVYIDRYGANLAAGNGHLDVLKWLAEHQIYPSQYGANRAAGNGHIKVLVWLAERQVYPSQEGADSAAGNGWREVLEWLAILGIYPSQHDADWVA